MGEQVKFQKVVFNDISDVKTFEAGKDPMVAEAKAQYLEAVQALGAAALAGDLEAAGKAQAKIGEVSEQLVSLAQSSADAKAFVASLEPAAPAEGGAEG